MNTLRTAARTPLSALLSVSILNAALCAQGWSTLRSIAPPTISCGMPIGKSAEFRWVTLCAAGDVNGDGATDILAMPFGFSQCPTGDLWNPYRMVFTPYVGAMLSGSTGASLWTSTLGSGLDMAWSVAAAGDIDGDGLADVLFARNGLARVLRGNDGSVIREHACARRISNDLLAGLGDVDSDGRDDYAVIRDTGTPARPFVFVHSGIDGSELRSHPGAIVRAAGDVDGDGHRDVLVGYAADPTAPYGSVTVFSGSTGLIVSRWTGTSDRRIGRSVAGGFDFDGDGTIDVCTTSNVGGASAITIASGTDGRLVATLRPTSNTTMLTFDRAGDVDGDGIEDFITNDSDAVHGAVSCVVSGRTGFVIGSEVTSLGGAVGDSNRDGAADVALLIDGDIVVRSYTPGPVTAELERIGVGCVGTSGIAPTIAAARLPITGTLSSFTLRDAPPQAAVALHLGDPTSLALDPIGMPMCTLFSRPFLTLPQHASSSGASDQGFRWTTAAAPIGATFYLQWAVLDPSANPLGVILSDALRMRVGS